MQPQRPDEIGKSALTATLDRYSEIVRETYKAAMVDALDIIPNPDHHIFLCPGNNLGPDGEALVVEHEFVLDNLPLPGAFAPPVSAQEFEAFSMEMIDHLKSRATELVPDLELPEDWVQMMRYTDGITWRGYNYNEIYWFCSLETTDLLENEEIELYRGFLRRGLKEDQLELITGWLCTNDNVNLDRFLLYIFCRAPDASTGWRVLEAGRGEFRGNRKIFGSIQEWLSLECDAEESCLRRVTQADVDEKVRDMLAREAAGEFS